MRVLVSEELVTSTQERLDFWKLLKSLAGVSQEVDVEQIANDVRIEMAQKVSAGLLALATGSDSSALAATLATSPMPAAGQAAPAGGAAEAGGFEPVWIETPECTACDECVSLNPKLFAYNDENKAVVVDPKAGPFKDIVKAAEKCVARIIHPGTPVNPNEKGLDKLIKRAEKYQ
jgi:pyruvate-ferredoxin/flavodoxin oxidoreductase